jgi:hypothetical protein
MPETFGDSMPESEDALTQAVQEGGEEEKSVAEIFAERKLRDKKAELNPESYEALEELVYEILGSGMDDLTTKKALNDAFAAVAPVRVEDAPEDVEAFRVATLDRLESSGLEGEPYDVLSQYINEALDKEIPLSKKSEMINEYFDVFNLSAPVEKQPEAKPDNGDDREAARRRLQEIGGDSSEIERSPIERSMLEAHEEDKGYQGRVANLANAYLNAEGVEARTESLANVGREIMTENENEAYVLTTVGRVQFELTLSEKKGDVLVYTVKDMATGATAIIEM